MANKIEKVSSTEIELSLTAKWEDVEKKYEDELKKIQLGATLPGFRKGKAPKALVEKKLGDSFLQEIASNAMDEALQKGIEELDAKDKPLPYSSTVLKDEEKVFPVKKGEDINFTVKYEILPEFDVKNYKGIDVEYPNVKISDEMVENEIKRLQEQNAIVKDKGDEPIAKGDVVTVDYEAVGEKDSKRDGYTFTVGDYTAYFDFDDEIIGAKKGDEKTIEKHYTADNRPVGFDKDSVTLKVKVLSVRSKELPKVDDEFAEDVSEEYKTVSDLKNGIRSRLEERLNDSLRETKIDILLDKIIPNVTLDVPKCMIDFEVASTLKRFSSQMGMSESDTIKFLTANGQDLNSFTEPWRKDAEHTIKAQLIVNKVRDDEHIEATDEELSEELKKRFPNEKDQESAAMYKDMIKDDLGYKKTIDFLLKENNFKPSKEEISYEDFASGAYLKKEEDNKEADKTNEESEDN